ncbi:trypsin-like serine protease [Levilactobacillus koreensis JCM 16448]|uniref:Serine protease n=1 Tax=Levilactobacillus koreensis TaxID=637971 RepID=A0AAC9ER14_9LACO|nr:PDZ domain-containing protein [Levilactobacillus koreensis]AKP63824.1 serine protease [Levilactobacillus koreensis]KRK86478.1 trypsin-like serine protease [Levilactobacillus koreensis JCM 16448]
MRTFIACGSFLLQPLVWLAVLRIWLTSRSRIKGERHDFGSAVFSDHFELRHLLTQGVVLGLGLSIINLLMGFSLPLLWIMVYEALAFATLLLIPTTVLPVLLIVVTTLITVLGSSYITDKPDLTTVGLHWGSVPVQNYFWLVAMFFLLLGHWLANYGGRFVSPKIYAKQRGKRIAGYPWREFLVLPMVTLVPGDWLTSHLAFWPVFHIQGQSFAILVIPLLVGLRFTVFRQVPRDVYQRLGKQMIWLAVIAMAFLGWSTAQPQILPVGLIVLLVGYGFILWRAKRYDDRQQFWYSQVDDGVRVLGIRPRTPAVKLDLNAGDIILECNHQSVNSETAFYEALLTNPTYCHLRVRNMAGELKVTETAIYSGAPHEIGIVLFRDQEG